MSVKITGGVANQPDVPEVNFGFGRNDGWMEVELVEDGNRVISSLSNSEVIVDDRVFDVFQPGSFAQKWKLDVKIFPRFGGVGELPN